MSLSSSLVSVVIYSIPDLNKISSFSVHKVNNKPVKIGRKLFIDKGKIILCFEGKVNIGDIKTGQIEKSFSIHDIVLDMTLYQLDDGTFLSVLSYSVVCHWKLDGTIISKTKGERTENKIIYCQGHNKGVISLYANLGQPSTKVLESMDETE